MEISRLLSDLHPRLVPFPIVLLLAGLLLDACGLLCRSGRALWAGRLLTIAGTVTLLAAFVCGICAEIWAGRSGVPHHQIKWHELAATAAAWGFVLLTAWRLFLDGRRPRALAAYLACGFALYTMMSITGWLGGKLVTDYGASVSGARAETILSLHDLNTLAQRQTDRNLEYSDLMHHAAGGFVLALTLAIFVRELWPRHAGKVRWVAPALLMIGGGLLFFTADLDLYPFSDPRQWYDREVQAHKLISVLLFAFGLRALWRVGHDTEAEPTEAHMRVQNRLIAVLALIGGGLLFTHVHTVAPYANVAAGVYVNHVVMGIVALAIGGVKLLDETHPLLGRSRFRAITFPALLAIEAFLLVTYTEGLPWFIGYGHYNRWGPSGGTIAPLGNLAGWGSLSRAELTFDPDTAQMNLRVLQRFDDEPLTIPASQITVIASQGYIRSAIPLQAVDFANGRASHFRGQAEFLRHARYFDARVELPWNGGGTRSGCFDPWVIPAITGIPPNQVAKYVCPMHEGVRSNEPGDCRLCGMSLVPLQRTIRMTLHGDKYAMDLVTSKRIIAAGENISLRFVPTLAATGEILQNIQIVHEHPLHLIIVGDDLVFFDHIHPVLQDDGSFVIDYAFPRDGTYLLFADIAPRGDRSQVFRLPVKVGTPPPHDPIILAPDLAPARQIGKYHVEIILQPRQLVSGRECQIAFRLTMDGKPVIDLEPYIGAMGHCVIISEDTQTYLHSHPEMLTAAPLPNERGGPEVSFHTVFPRPGKYKVWGQFKRGQEIIVADFVLDVRKPLVPKWLSDFLIFD